MKTQHEILMEDPEFRRLLSVETLVAEASEAIAKQMAQQNISKADLAWRLGKSRAWVTQLLSGKTNMTIRTLAEVLFALDVEVKLQTQTPGWKSGKQAAPGGHANFLLEKSALEVPFMEFVYRLDIPELSPAEEDLTS